MNEFKERTIAMYKENAKDIEVILKSTSWTDDIYVYNPKGELLYVNLVDSSRDHPSYTDEDTILTASYFKNNQLFAIKQEKYNLTPGRVQEEYIFINYADEEIKLITEATTLYNRCSKR